MPHIVVSCATPAHPLRGWEGELEDRALDAEELLEDQQYEFEQERRAFKSSHMEASPDLLVLSRAMTCLQGPISPCHPPCRLGRWKTNCSG